jgi:hypothetical protein
MSLWLGRGGEHREVPRRRLCHLEPSDAESSSELLNCLFVTTAPGDRWCKERAMRIPNQQRCHYSKLARQERARTEAIRALVNLTQFPDDTHAAIQCLRVLEAAPDEIENELRMLRVQGVRG